MNVPGPATIAAKPGRTAAVLEIRPIRPEDKRALIASFERLTDESRYRRFLSPHAPPL